MLAEEAQRARLESMFWPYEKEMAQYFAATGIDEKASGASRYLSQYWTEQTRYPYLFSQGSDYFGFCLVNRHSVLGHDVDAIAEFYILPDQRRRRLGSVAAKEVLRMNGPEWEVAVVRGNSAAEAFWKRVIAEACGSPVRAIRHKGDDGIERFVYRFRRVT